MDISVSKLESILGEFYSGDDRRKGELNEVIMNLKKTNGFWRSIPNYVTEAISRSTKAMDFVLFFCGATLEELFTTNRWKKEISLEELVELRKWLLSFLLNSNNPTTSAFKTNGSFEGSDRGSVRSVPHSVSKLSYFVFIKYCRVLILISKHLWLSRTYNVGKFNFMEEIVKFISEPAYCSFGLILAKLVSEEFAKINTDISFADYSRILNYFNSSIASLLAVLTRVLNSMYEMHVRVESSRIRKSSFSAENAIYMTGRSPASSFSSPGSLTMPNTLRSDVLNSRMMQHLSTPFTMENNEGPLGTNFDESGILIVKSALETLNHLFSWIDLNVHVSPLILGTFFKYIPLADSTYSVIALNCANELLERNCTPPEFQQYLMHMFQHIFTILKHLNQCNFQEVDENLLDETSRFIQMFLSHHVSRVESSDLYSISQFLELLYVYTDSQISPETFLNALSIWKPFIIFLDPTISKSNQGNPKKYFVLLNNLLDCIILHCQGNHIKELLNESWNDFNGYLNSCIDIITYIGNLDANSILDKMFIIWRQQNDDVMLNSLDVGNISKSEELQFKIHNLAFSLTIISNLSSQNTDPAFFESRFVWSSQTLSKIMKMLEILQKNQLYSLQLFCITEIYGAIFQFIYGYAEWFKKWYTRNVIKQDAFYADFNPVLRDIYLSITTLLQQNNVSKDILSAALNIIYAFNRHIRPLFLSNSDAGKVLFPLYEHATDLIFSLPFNPLGDILCRGLVAGIILPPHKLVSSNTAQVEALKAIQQISEDRWNSDAFNMFKSFIGPFHTKYTEIASSKSRLDQSSLVQLSSLIKIWTSMVRTCSTDENSLAKKLLFEGLKDTFSVSLELLKICLNRPTILVLLIDHFYVVLTILSKEAGIQFTESTLSVIIGIIGSEQHLPAAIARTNDSTTTTVIINFFNMLSSLFSVPGKFQSIIPNIVTMCIRSVHPNLAVADTLVTRAYFPVFESILLNYWSLWFTKPQRTSIYDNVGPSMPVSEERLCEFEDFLKVIINSLKSPDIELFKLNLKFLHDLNSKKMFFKMQYFLQKLMFPFIWAFIEVLVMRTHEILKDDINLLLYEFASSDFNIFFGQIVPKLIENLSTNLPREAEEILLSDLNPNSRDHVSFSKNIDALVNDWIYYSSKL